MSADKDYISLPLRELLNDAAAKTPTPGGGSVAAVVGGLACSLARMVLEYTIGKPQYAVHDERLRQLLAELQRGGDEFAQLVSEDMRAYEAVVAARKMDAAVREQAATRATAVPMEIVTVAGALVARMDEVKAMVNPRLIGDLKAAATLAAAAAQSAACTVRDNLESSPDRHESARLEDQLDLLLGRIERHCQSVVHFRIS